MSITILGIESSCDETSAAVICDGVLLSNKVASQSVHKAFGGVVPELASRAHQQNIVPVVAQAISDAGIKKEELNAVSFTRGPGLLGALLVGTSFAKAMALSLNIPLIEINHMQAHILSHFIDDPNPSFPFICLTVSGGHTQLVVVRSFLEMEVIGQTHDDAVGEAFDKSAKMLGLPYPGGHEIDKRAARGNPEKFSFPKSKMQGFDFSFSGIKTAVLYFLQEKLSKNKDFIHQNLNDICASIQKALIDMLLIKLVLASRHHKINEIAIAGGVAANFGLRRAIELTAVEENWNYYFPAQEYCTDNAGMIAMAAYYKFQKNQFADLSISPLARMPF